MSDPKGDPLGRRALFSPPPTATTGNARAHAGKQSLYSASAEERRCGTVVVDCSSCGARTRLGLVEFAWRHLPVWLWIPWARHSNWMSCPVCERRAWLGVSWLS